MVMPIIALSIECDCMAENQDCCSILHFGIINFILVLQMLGRKHETPYAPINLVSRCEGF